MLCCAKSRSNRNKPEDPRGAHPIELTDPYHSIEAASVGFGRSDASSKHRVSAFASQVIQAALGSKYFSMEILNNTGIVSLNP